MITLEACCKSGHYVAAVVPMMNKHLLTEYHVLVFQHGHEVYEETERSLEDAMETAKAYLDWRTEQDLACLIHQRRDLFARMCDQALRKGRIGQVMQCGRESSASRPEGGGF